MHRYDDTTPVEETLSTLNDLVRQGKVRYLGVSNWTASQIAEACLIIAAKGWEPLVSLQPQYSILTRDIEVEILPVCRKFGLGVIPWSPLGGGMLTGKYKAGEEPKEGTRFAAPGPVSEIWRTRALNERNHAIVAVVLEEAGKLDVSPIALALAWNLARPGIVAPIIGPKNEQQLKDNLAALDVTLPERHDRADRRRQRTASALSARLHAHGAAVDRNDGAAERPGEEIVSPVISFIHLNIRRPSCSIRILSRRRPQSVGIDSRPARCAARARRQRKSTKALLPACQVAIARHGKIAAMASFGDATDESLFNVFSSTKAITSAAGWLVMQDGKLASTSASADIVPEFGTNGKDAITVEQLFTHTAGFPHAPFRVSEWFDHKRRLERFAEWTLNWPVGSRFEYHPTSSMYVIAEIVERRSGDRVHRIRARTASRSRSDSPTCSSAVRREQHHRIAPVTHVGDALTDADYAALGVPMPPVTEVTEEALTAFNSDRSAAGTGTRRRRHHDGGRARTVLPGVDQRRSRTSAARRSGASSTLNDALKVRNHFPDLMGIPANRALGVVIAGDEHRNARGFGHTNSPLAFGHGGAGGQIAWGDPATGISLGYCTNGHDRNVIRQARRGIGISSRAAVCAA